MRNIMNNRNRTGIIILEDRRDSKVLTICYFCDEKTLEKYITINNGFVSSFSLLKHQNYEKYLCNRRNII